MSIKYFFVNSRLGHLGWLLARYNRFVGSKKESTYYPNEQQKSKSKIFLDQMQTIMSRGGLEENYYIYGHDRKSVKDRGDYILEPEHVKMVLDANCHPFGKNPTWDKQFNYISLLRDKYVFALMMEGFGLPIPETMGVATAETFFCHKRKERMPLAKIVNEDMDVMFKPVTGSGGVGMHHIVIKDGVAYKSGKAVSTDELSDMLGKERYLVQKFVTEQHKDMLSLYPGAINTLRVTMLRDDKGEIHLLGVMCLMGAGDMIVSNWHYGGVIINVKPDGYLNEYGYSNSLKRIDRHPDTGVVFKEFKVPFYDEVLALSRRAMESFYGLKTLGWDIAITPDGPIFIEGNDRWGLPAHQMVEERGWRDYYRRYFSYKK